MTSELNRTASRRDALKSGLIVAGVPAFLKGAPAGQAIRVGLVGCGGRGTGAAAQALKADDYSELTAVADVFQNRIDDCLARLSKAAGPKVKVENANMFVGLDAYRKLIDSGVDVVLLATPPGFRPQHLRAAIEAGKHVFCEKPVAVDSPGVREVLATAKMAQEKNLSLVAGFCWRYSNYIQETFEQIHNGAIGDIVSYYGTYYTSPVKPMPPESTRPAGMSDV
jgi:predicted dehydrogenase